MKEYSNAVEDCTKLLEFDSGNAEVYCVRGFAYGALGEVAKSIDDYTKAVELKPDYEEVYLRRALTYAALGDREKAKADLEIFQKLASKRGEKIEDLQISEIKIYAPKQNS